MKNKKGFSLEELIITIIVIIVAIILIFSLLEYDNNQYDDISIDVSTWKNFDTGATGIQLCVYISNGEHTNRECIEVSELNLEDEENEKQIEMIKDYLGVVEWEKCTQHLYNSETGEKIECRKTKTILTDNEDVKEWEKDCGHFFKEYDDDAQWECHDFETGEKTNCQKRISNCIELKSKI